MTRTKLAVDRKNSLRRTSPQRNSVRWLSYGLWIVVSLILFAGPLGSVIRLALNNDDASHILLIPLISAWVIYLERRTVFHRPFYDLPGAAFLCCFTAFIYGPTLWFSANWNLTESLAGHMLALVLVWITGFALFFGRVALQAARFPLVLLFLAVPLPDFLLNHIVYFLQKGSSEITSALFDLGGIPFLREGFTFHFGRVNIEVARECSGIRSSMAVLILALLAAHFYLRAVWTKTLFVVCGILVMVIKNGVRIVVLTSLALYVDPGFLFGRLHHEGGIIFFFIGLLLLVPILWILRSVEAQHRVIVEGGPEEEVRKSWL